MPDHSTFSKARHGRFRDSDLLRVLFEETVWRCLREGLVGGEGFAVDASMSTADAHRQRGVAGVAELDPAKASRAVREYMAVLDEAAFGATSETPPKYVSPVDPAARWTAAASGPAVYAYCTNYLIDVAHAVIVDVEPSTAIRQGEVQAARTMVERTAETFEIKPERLIADTGYGSAENLAWLVDEEGIERTSRCSTSLPARTGPSRPPTSPMSPKRTATPVRPASRCTGAGASSPSAGPTRRERRSTIALPSWTAAPAR